ncbi:MAG: hypothetical protein ACLUEC_02680 [Coprococcus sp.]
MIFLKRRALMTRAGFNYKTVSGIGSITLENCVETKFKRLVLSGKSVQGENPSIESPKEIKNSGKYDEVSGKYVIDVSVTGKNLFDISKYPFSHANETIIISPNEGQVPVKNGIDITEGVVFDENTVYCISYDSYKVTQANADWTNIFTFYYTDGEYQDLYTRHFNGQEKKFFNSLLSKTVRNVAIRNPWKVGIEINKVQIEKSTKPTDYEPYREPQTVQLQLDEPLRGIGEYKDDITKDGVLRRIKEIVLDESTGFETYWATLDKTFAFISPTIKDATVINNTPNRLLCNYFKVLPYGLDRTDEEVCVLFNRRFHIRFLKERNIDTVEKLKEWLKQNPIKIQYLLQEPVLEPFENSLDSLHANDGTTIVSVDSGEAETGIEVEYAVKE